MMRSIPFDLSARHATATTKFITILRPPIPGDGGPPQASSVDTIMIPPINTNIFMKTVLDTNAIQKKLTARPSMAEERLRPIPPKYRLAFDWRKDHRGDQKDSINKNITPVGNQYGCGCCWAFSIADAVSDVFVQSPKSSVATNPRCSVTYILSCYPHCGMYEVCNDASSSLQCGGGTIAPTLLWISENGVSSLACVDYAWCSKNDSCVYASGNADVLNGLIPDCTDLTSQNCQKKYYIKTPRSVGLESTPSSAPTKKAIDDQREMMKRWIYHVGTVLTGFFVYQNLLVGNFSSEQNPDNIYLEEIDYSTGTFFTDENTNKFEGGHAVCVIGWGTGRVHNSLISDTALHSGNTSGFTQVPYWIVRNSWSEKWGENGCFKMAMFPFNKVSQFDAYINVNTDQGSGGAGGFVVFEPDPRLASSYMSATPRTSNTNDPPRETTTTMTIITKTIVVFILILLFVLTIFSISIHK